MVARTGLAVAVVLGLWQSVPAAAVYDTGSPPTAYDCWPTLCHREMLEIHDDVPTPFPKPCLPYGDACSVEYGDMMCVIYIAQGHALPRDYILRHEYGHCNGWPADHPR